MDLAEEITQSEEYAILGRKIIDDEMPELLDVDIAFLSSAKEKKKQGNKLICGECIKVNDNYKWCCPYDFMVVFYEPNIDYFTNEQRAILMRHELMHIGIKPNGEYYVVPHDIEDFMDILEKYGMRWNCGE